MISCPSCQVEMGLDEELIEGDEIECEQCTATLEIVTIKPLKIKLVG